MGAFGDIGTRGLLCSARQPACATGLVGSGVLGRRGMTAWLVKSPQTGLTKTVLVPATAVRRHEWRALRYLAHAAG
jgi:hypothetical protein